MSGAARDEGGVPAAHSGGLRTLLRVEGAALLAAATLAYSWGGWSWYLYLGLFFVPDLSMLAYTAGPRIGAFAYNVLHATVAPLMLGCLGLAAPEGPWMPIAAIWLAHIGLDRMLGYGLKSSAGFGHTHLGPIGRRERPA